MFSLINGTQHVRNLQVYTECHKGAVLPHINKMKEIDKSEMFSAQRKFAASVIGSEFTADAFKKKFPKLSSEKSGS